MARVTLQTVADAVGVSRMTVSNAFSQPDQLSAELRQRILAAADELGYGGPDPRGRALARGTTGAVGVLLTDSLRTAFSDEVATAFLAAIVDELAPTGFALTLLTADDGEDAAEARRVIPARDVAIDGAVVYSCRPESASRDWLIRRRLPLVNVDQDPDPGVSSVNVDDRGGARAAAAHVVTLGHREVAVVTHAIDGPSGEIELDDRRVVWGHPQQQRLHGWLDALREAAIEPVMVSIAKHSDDSIRTQTRSLLERETAPTAVLCFSDVVALNVIAVATEIGLTVPADLTVVGFDDSPAARRASPALTTVRQDVTAKGQAAAEALRTAIEQHRTGAPAEVSHVMLPTELVVRASTAPPPSRRRS